MKNIFKCLIVCLSAAASISAQAENYPYLTLLCTSEGYTGQFIVQFGDEELSTGEVIKAGVHNVVNNNRFLVDEAVSETTGMFGEYTTDKLILKSGGSVEWYVDMAGNDKVYLSESDAIFGDSAMLDCESVKLLK